MPETPAPTIHDLSIPPFLGQLLVQGLELLSGQRGASFVPFLFQPQGAVGGKPSWLVTASAPSPFNCKRAKVYTMWTQVAPKDCRRNSQSSPNTTGHQVLITWKNCFMAETILPRFPPSLSHQVITQDNKRPYTIDKWQISTNSLQRHSQQPPHHRNQPYITHYQPRKMEMFTPCWLVKVPVFVDIRWHVGPTLSIGKQRCFTSPAVTAVTLGHLC